jgi:hypothetical protein
MNEEIKVGDFVNCAWGGMFCEVTAIDPWSDGGVYGREFGADYCQPIGKRGDQVLATEKDYIKALELIEPLMDAASQEEEKELSRLCYFVEAWENKYYP